MIFHTSLRDWSGALKRRLSQGANRKILGKNVISVFDRRPLWSRLCDSLRSLNNAGSPCPDSNPDPRIVRVHSCLRDPLFVGRDIVPISHLSTP